MTIAIAVRTLSAVVFAADSKLTVKGIGGIRADGAPNWVEQTYDNATKVVHDRTRRLMALAAGIVNIGQVSALDFIATYAVQLGASRADEDAAIVALLDRMAEEKRAFYEKMSGAMKPEEWPGPALLLAIPSSDSAFTPRLWAVDMSGEHYQHAEILKQPGIWMEGSYDEVFSLLYGFHPAVSTQISRSLGLDAGALADAIVDPKVLSSIDQLNLQTMPLQDAIDLAVFLADVQIEMDRFLPGSPVCGGPVDVMVLRMVPTPEILTFPGKALHHPRNRGTVLK
jgi:hypothetical protein